MIKVTIIFLGLFTMLLSSCGAHCPEVCPIVDPGPPIEETCEKVLLCHVRGRYHRGSTGQVLCLSEQGAAAHFEAHRYDVAGLCESH